ncbi:MAG: ABC transporter permease [Gemmatimonadales bacterium]|nr:MAG: ABC transporter permease [Gemmatimonadales bacterium]
MQLIEGARLALMQIRQEKLKSGFSVLGVVIGVMFLIVVVSVVEGMDRYITEDFAEVVYGVNTIQVRQTPSVQIGDGGAQWREMQRRPRVTLDDARAIREGLSVPALVGVETGATRSVRTEEGRRAENVQISAISPEVLQIRAFHVSEGRPFSPQEAARGVPVAILGQGVAESLFPEEGGLDSRIRIGGFPYRIVGILEPQGSLFGISLDNVILIPAQSRAGDILPERGAVGSIIVQPRDPAHVRTVQADIESAMRITRRLGPAAPNDFQIDTAEESLAFWDQISTVLFIALPGLVGISLVVGGIVIMNIMLVSVMERTREIGVRKALGARRRDIISQFLVESTTLSGLGAVLGVAIGVGLTAIVRATTPLPAAIAPHWIALGVALGMTVGILSGVYPAVQASRLDPVEALRRE